MGNSRRPLGRYSTNGILLAMLAPFLIPVTLCLPAGMAHATTMSAEAPRAPTITQIYQRVQGSATQPDMLYHATIREQSVEGPFHTSITRAQWVDGQRNVARERYQLTYTVTDPRTKRSQVSHFRGTTITTAKGLFSRAGPPPRVQAVEPPSCYGTGLLAADVILGCPGPTEQSTTRVEMGRNAGRPAVVLVTKGTVYGEDQNTTSTTRLYLDPATFLPLASVSDGTLDIGKKYATHATATYTHTFQPVSSVASNFFDPSSIGYRDPAVTIGQQLDKLPRNFTAYWLGSSFSGGGALPPLVINRLEPASGVGYLFILGYTPSDHPYGAPVVMLQEYPASNQLVQSDRGPCYGKVKERVTLASGKGLIYSAHGLHACAFFQTTIVEVDTPGVNGPGGSTKSPYASVLGLETVLQHLQPRIRAGAAANGRHAESSKLP